MLAHDAREGGELLHELGGEVRAGQRGSLGRHLGVSLGEAEGRRELGRELLYALRLLEHGSELGLEGDTREFRLEVGELLAGVSLVEELGILVPRLEHGLVPRADDVGVDGSVSDGDEVREEVAGGRILHGEVPLVLAHDHHQHLLGKLEERGVEPSDDGGGRLDQVHDLVDETAGLAGGRGYDAVDTSRELLGGGPDGGAARVEADLDRVALEETGVVRGAGDLGRGRGAVAEETRGGAGRDADCDEGKVVLTVHGEEPTEGPAEGGVAVPPHRLGEVDAADDAGEGVGEDLVRGATDRADVGPHVLAVLLQRRRVDPVLLRETHRSLGRGDAVLLKGAGERGTPVALLLALLRGDEVLDLDDHAARGGAHDHAAVGETRGVKARLDRLGELLGSRRDVRRGKLLGANLRLPDAEGKAELLAPRHPEHGGLARELPHAREELLSFGDSHGAPRVQDVKRVRSLEELVERGEGQPGVEHAVSLLVGELEPELVRGDVRLLHVEHGHLVLVLKEHLSVRHGVVVPDVLEVLHALKGHHDALEAVGDLHRGGRHLEGAALLEVGELGHLHAVQPNLPPETPRAQHG